MVEMMLTVGYIDVPDVVLISTLKDERDEWLSMVVDFQVLHAGMEEVCSDLNAFSSPEDYAVHDARQDTDISIGEERIDILANRFLEVYQCNFAEVEVVCVESILRPEKNRIEVLKDCKG